MRYYSIEIEGGTKYTSHPSSEHGPADPGALQVRMDLFVSPFAVAPAPNSHVQIWGIPLSTIRDATALALKGIKIRGGMGQGLPLANPAQAGLLIDGTIMQPFGNWIDTDMTLDLYVGIGEKIKDVKDLETPRDFAWTWKKGENLGDVVKRTLQKAVPEYPVSMQVKNGITTDHDEGGHQSTLKQFADWVLTRSKGIIGPGYSGIQVTMRNSELLVYDNSTEQNPKKINFNDLIGQPTWLGLIQAQATLVMRSDISVGDVIEMPTTIATTTQGAIAPGADASAQLRQGIAIQGKFKVTQVHHVGDFRSSDARAWVTVVDMFQLQNKAPADAASQTDLAPVPPSGFTQKREPYT